MRTPWLIGGALLLADCSPKATAIHAPASARIDSLYGPDLERVRSPDRVEATRLVHGPRGSLLVVESGAPVPLDRNSAGRISALLVDERSYGSGDASGCIPQPGVKLRFVREEEHADVYLCFECGILISGDLPRIAGREDPPGAPVRSGRSGVWAQFDPSAAELHALLKPFFPNDEIMTRH
jgi:hypothetical protein